MPRTNPKHSLPLLNDSSITSADVLPKNLMFLGAIKSNFNKKQYLQLKYQANRAMKREKVFAIYGNCEPVRTALVERGWIEKLPYTRSRLDLSTFKKKRDSQPSFERILLSSFVAKAPPNFIWSTRDDLTMEEKHRFFKAKFNRLDISYLWATKQGLCAALKNEGWFYIDDVAEVKSPRTYTCIDKIDFTKLKNDFKLTACSSLLKWLLSMIENNEPVFQESGNIAINVIVFAINRCKEYIFRKQNKDIDKPTFLRASNGQWNAFLKNYYTLIASQDTFKTDKDNKVPLFLRYAKFLLQEMHKYRPQLSCEGYHDIWIIKPAHCNRGRGIRMTSKLGVLMDLMSKGKYVAQKYIEEPLLIYDTKFDIRQYYLVTSSYPLEIWMYKDCYLKFSSQRYSIIDYHESIHLTNNAVQRKYKNCNDRNPDLPDYNMWSSDTFKEYLTNFSNENAWDTIIYPGMKKSIVAVMTSCQDSISHGAKNRFELYGCDFILDKSYRPWLIEINSSPDFNPTTPVTSKICPAVLSDVIKVAVDYAANSISSTGRFECIYHQTPCAPASDAETDQNLRVRGHALPIEYFYRGSIQLVETNSLASSAKQQDVAAMLKTFRMMHNFEDIFKEPDENSFQLQRNDDTKGDVQSFGSNDVLDVPPVISDSEQVGVQRPILSIESVASPIPTITPVLAEVISSCNNPSTCEVFHEPRHCVKSASTPIAMITPVLAQVIPSYDNSAHESEHKPRISVESVSSPFEPCVELSETTSRQGTDMNTITKSVDQVISAFSEFEKIFENSKIIKGFLDTGTNVGKTKTDSSKEQNKITSSIKLEDKKSSIRFTAEEGDERFIQIKNKLYSFLNRLDKN